MTDTPAAPVAQDPKPNPMRAGAPLHERLPEFVRMVTGDGSARQRLGAVFAWSGGDDPYLLWCARDINLQDPLVRAVASELPALLKVLVVEAREIADQNGVELPAAAEEEGARWDDTHDALFDILYEAEIIQG